MLSLFEIIHVICFVVLGVIAGIQLKNYSCAKEYNIKFSYVQYVVSLLIAFLAVVVLGYINQHIQVTNFLALSSVLLAIIMFLISYRMFKKNL